MYKKYKIRIKNMSIVSRLLFAMFVSFSIISFVNAQTTDTTQQRGNNNGNTNNGSMHGSGDLNNNGTGNNPDATGGAVHTPSTGTTTPGTTPGTTTPGTTAPGVNTPAPSAAAATVEQAAIQFMQAINRGDAAAAAGFYADDAVIMPPDIDIIQGANGIKNFWSKVITIGGRFDTLTTAKVNVNNETVDEVGRYFLTINRPGQNPMQEKGKFVFVWKRQPDDTWKITTHMWNRSKQ
jgi:ketosteroid isomerase-like protein